MHCIEADIQRESDEILSSPDRVQVIDGMAVVNQVDFKGLQSCKDFAVAFTRKIQHMASAYTEVRLIFDRYIEKSLKSRTRNNRTAGIQIRYIIGNDIYSVSVS